MNRPLLIVLMCLAGTIPATAQTPATNEAAHVLAGNYTLDKDHGKITWSINHLGFSTYIGQFSDVTATLSLDPAMPSKSVLTATIATGSVGTLNPELDKNLKSSDFFAVQDFPTASFVATKVEPTGANTAKIEGNLTLLGVTKPETIDVTFNQAGVNPVEQNYTVGFDGVTTIKRSDFGMTKYLPMLGDDVVLTIEAEFIKTN